MTERISTWLTVLLVPLVACSGVGGSGSEGPVPLAPEGFGLEPTGQGEILPVWQTNDERLGAKSDDLDPRGLYEDIYGITQPPVGTVRAMAEFEPVDGVLIAWYGQMLDFLVPLIREVAKVSDVYVITDYLSYTGHLKTLLPENGVDVSRVHYLEYPHDAFWTRDFGPISVERADGSVAFIDARYYYNRRRDDAVPTLLADYLGIPVYRPNLSTEGGNFMTNGEGLCVVTRWLVQENENLYENALVDIQHTYFGCERTIVLERMNGEGTGHVDMFAKFTARDTILVGQYDPADDPVNAAILNDNAARLAELTLSDGTPVKVVRIPMPSAGGGVYRSYTNSLLANGTVIMPSYDTDFILEPAAVAAYEAALPAGYTVATVDSSQVIQWGGAVHCTAMQFNFRPLGGGTELPDATPTLDTPVVDPPDGAGTTFESKPDIPIPDLKQAVDTIEVDLAGSVDGIVVVEVSIEHSYVGDLVVILEHEGLWAELQRMAGGSAQGLYKKFSIQGFEGVPLAGKWRLVVEDHAEQDEGVLESWSLTLR